MDPTWFLFQDRRGAGSSGAGSSGDRRPVKVWNANRNIKKALVVGTYEEFLRKGNNSLNITDEAL